MPDNSSLGIIFAEYQDRVRETCVLAQSPPNVNLALIKNHQMKSCVDQAELSSQFDTLVDATRDEFSVRTVHGDHRLRLSIGNFFRRSGFYLDVFNGSALDSAEYLQKYENAFTRDEIEHTIYAPLNYVEFSKRTIDIADFQLVRLSRAELDDLFSNRTRELFWPDRVIDSHLLQEFFFIRVKIKVPRRNSDSRDFVSNVDFSGRVSELGPAVDPRLEKILRILCLFPWENADSVRKASADSDDPFQPWFPCQIPFAIALDDDLLNVPCSAPNLALLATEPDYDSSTGEERDWERKCIATSFDEAETNEFVSRVSYIAQCYNLIDPLPTEWEFFGIATRFLTKAFIDDETEQLLWHIVAMDALLGTPNETKRLAKRIAAVLESDSSAREKVSQDFMVLYDIRSKAIHGKPPKKEARLIHLRQARVIARRCTFFVLNCLANLKAECLRLGISLPSRDEIIRILDANPAELDRTKTLLEVMPAGFPHVQEWIRYD